MFVASANSAGGVTGKRLKNPKSESYKGENQALTKHKLASERAIIPSRIFRLISTRQEAASPERSSSKTWFKTSFNPHLAFV